MRASFSSRDADNHTAFIRIKTNASSEDEFIILPVEVEVTTGERAIAVAPDVAVGFCLEWDPSLTCLLPQPLEYTPLQRCSTLAHYDRKVRGTFSTNAISLGYLTVRTVIITSKDGYLSHGGLFNHPWQSVVVRMLLICLHV